MTAKGSRACTGSRRRIRSDSAQRHLISPSLIKRPDWNEGVFNVGMGVIKPVQEEREAENKAERSYGAPAHGPRRYKYKDGAGTFRLGGLL